MNFTYNSIDIDPDKVTEEIVTTIQDTVLKRFKKKGVVIGLSGGLDSSVVLALAVRALGSERVHGVMMPEKDSDDSSVSLAEQLAQKFGVSYDIENITPVLKGFRCYERRDEAVKRVFPAYEDGDSVKLALPGNLLETPTLNIYQLTLVKPDGSEYTKRLPLNEYLQIVAASNFKQRTRMTMLYYHGEMRNYAVLGTANKNEHELGFFVKYGDGAADIFPIRHLFKTQIFQLAEYLGVPAEITQRKPTTDTYSAEQTQEEFFYRIPFAILDRVWYGYEKGAESIKIGETVDLSAEQVERVIVDIKRKKQTTNYLRSQILDKLVQ